MQKKSCISGPKQVKLRHCEIYIFCNKQDCDLRDVSYLCFTFAFFGSQYVEVFSSRLSAYKRMYVQPFFLKNEQHRASFVYNDPHHRRPHSGRRQNLIRSRLYSIIRTLTLCTAVQEEKGLEI